MSSQGIAQKKTFFMRTIVLRILFFSCYVAVAGAILSITAGNSTAKDSTPPSAADLLRMLPTSIFDNTPEPLNEEELELLLVQGYTHAWVIVENKTDSMRMTATGDNPGEVHVHILRSSPGGIIMLGARTNDSCATELWAYNPYGGIIPYDTPPDPTFSDLFTQNKHLPKNLVPSYRICLENGMLEAVPLFWDTAGPVSISPDNRVFYLWNGKEFVKRVIPAADAVDFLAAPPAPLGKRQPGQ